MTPRQFPSWQVGWSGGIGRAIRLAQRGVAGRLDRLSEGRFAILVSVPGLLLIGLLVVPPLLAAVWLSLWRIDLLKDGITPFIALRNYMTRLPADSAFLGTLPVTVLFGAVVTAIAVPVALGTAILINRLHRWRSIATLALILPWAVAPVADATLWALLFRQRSSPLNGLLHTMGLPPIVLGDAPGAFLVMLLAVTWRAVPLLGILFLGALRGVPAQLARAARLDGASPLQAFRYVVLPAMAPTVIVACVLQLILTLQVFDVQYALFRDNPPPGTTLSAFAIFEAISQNFSLGYGAAMTVTLAGVIGLCLLVFSLLFGRRVRTLAAPTDEPDGTARPTLRPIGPTPIRWDRTDVEAAARSTHIRGSPGFAALAAARAMTGRLLRALGAFAIWVWLFGPIAWILLASVQSDGAIASGSLNLNPFALDLFGYRLMLGDPAFRSALQTSIVITLGATLLAFGASVLAAYPLARFPLRGVRGLMAFLVGTQLIPPIALAIPLLFLFLRINARNTVGGLVLINAAFWAPILVLLLRSAFLTVPSTIEAAARMDGLSRLGVIFRMTLRVAAPAVGAALAIVMVGVWNDFVFVSTLGGKDTSTVTRFLGQDAQSSSNILAATVVLTVAPCIALIALVRGRLPQLEQGERSQRRSLHPRAARDAIRRLALTRRETVLVGATAVSLLIAAAVVFRAVDPGPRGPVGASGVAVTSPSGSPRPAFSLRPSPTPAPPSRVAQIATLIAKQGITDDSPGCAVAISEGGQIVFEGGFGLADMQTRRPITPDTKFDVASVSKQFTAASILLLVQDGRIALTDDIRRYLPELPDYGKDRVVRISDLIYSRSGLPDEIDAVESAGFQTTDHVTAAQTLAAIAHVKGLNFKPGTQFEYNSANFFLARIIVERVSGGSFNDFVKARIFTPLGMTSSVFDDHTGERPFGEANAYLEVRILTGRGFDPDDFPWDVVGGGGLQTTARDLQRWAANFDLPRVGGPDFLASQLVVGAKDGVNGYAAGLRVWEHNGRTFYLHGGGWDMAGFRAGLFMDLVDHVAVSLTCNLASIDPYALGFAIYDIWHPIR